MSNIFSTITIKTSNNYTKNCIKSFFECTRLDKNDDVFLINNDQCNIDYLKDFKKVKVINNKTPLNFAQNTNQIIKIAELNKKDVIVFNNDLIFTKDWFESFKDKEESISIPSTNQLFEYSYLDKLKLKPTMSLEDFSDNYEALDKIVAMHNKKFEKITKCQGLLMPFWCFKLPHKIFKEVGKFDESFGNGAEDIDYRIRSALMGYEVNFLLHSYLLHFHGKSTWDSEENINKNYLKRDESYTKNFEKKWGKELTQIFVTRKNFLNILENKNLYSTYKAGNWSELIRRILKK